MAQPIDKCTIDSSDVRVSAGPAYDRRPPDWQMQSAPGRRDPTSKTGMVSSSRSGRPVWLVTLRDRLTNDRVSSVGVCRLSVCEQLVSSTGCPPGPDGRVVAPWSMFNSVDAEFPTTRPAPLSALSEI